MWVWVNTYRYTFSGMNIHLPAILAFTSYQGFDPSPCLLLKVPISSWLRLRQSKSRNPVPGTQRSKSARASRAACATAWGQNSHRLWIHCQKHGFNHQKISAWAAWVYNLCLITIWKNSQRMASNLIPSWMLWESPWGFMPNKMGARNLDGVRKATVFSGGSMNGICFTKDTIYGCVRKEVHTANLWP